MTEQNRDQLDEDLISVQKILDTHRRNRRRLAERQAELGGALDLGAVNQLQYVEEQIAIYEAEVARLKTEVVVDQYLFAEARYRRLLAEQLDNECGRITTVGGARLEEMRLQLGIAPERVQQLEHEIRVSLAKETFLDLREEILADVAGVYGDIHVSDNHPYSVVLRKIGRAVRLDIDIAVDLVRKSLPRWPQPSTADFEQSLLQYNNVGVDEREHFHTFILRILE